MLPVSPKGGTGSTLPPSSLCAGAPGEVRARGQGKLGRAADLWAADPAGVRGSGLGGTLAEAPCLCCPGFGLAVVRGFRLRLAFAS